MGTKHKDNKQTEAVNHPSHYADGEIECIDAMIAAQGKVAVTAFCHLNAIKYLWRAGRKDRDKMAEDFEKARWYIDKAIELYGKVRDEGIQGR